MSDYTLNCTCTINKPEDNPKPISISVIILVSMHVFRHRQHQSLISEVGSDHTLCGLPMQAVGVVLIAELCDHDNII